MTVVGDRTYGKPVGEYGLPFCDKVLNAVSFVLKNAQGEADYFTGLPATCPAGDALERQLGDVEEASLKEAIVYLRTGACTPPVVDPTAPPAPPRPIRRAADRRLAAAARRAVAPARDRAPRGSGDAPGRTPAQRRLLASAAIAAAGAVAGGARPVPGPFGLLPGGAGEAIFRAIPLALIAVVVAIPAMRRSGRRFGGLVGIIAVALPRRRADPDLDRGPFRSADPRRDDRHRQSAALRRGRPAPRPPANSVDYGGEAVARHQRASDGDLRPLIVKAPPPRVLAMAADTARAEGWTVLAQDIGFGDLGRLEATDTSFLFGRLDDIVVRIVPHPAGSRVDVRSSAAGGWRRRRPQRQADPALSGISRRAWAAEPAGAPAP